MSRRGALRLLNGDDLHQRPEVLVDRLLLWVDRLRKAMQKHPYRGDVLASPSELWGIVPPVDDVALDLAGATLGAARRVTHAGRNMLPRACQRRRWLVLPPLS